MNSRQRFQQTMNFGQSDHAPLFEEGIREEVLEEWRSQGLPADKNLAELFLYDQREEIAPELEPRPYPSCWPKTVDDLKELRKRLDPDDPGRLPAGWKERVHAWRSRDFPLLLRVHEGFFLSMGVEGWGRFTEVIQLLVDDPDFVHASMNLQGEFAARLAEKILQQVEVDGAIFSEPIGGNHGPLISPRMYEEFVLDSYRPLLEVLKRYRVSTIILRTYANARLLLPAVLKAGFNCLWAHECNMQTMDYRAIRAEFGPQLRLIGGIDTDVLRLDQEAIRREVEEKVPPLLAQGGYIPLADSRVREGVPFKNYTYYRGLLEEIVIQS